MEEDDAASVSRESPAPVEGGDEQEGPRRTQSVEPHGDEGCADLPDGGEEGGGETMASNGNGSAASKAASATSQVRDLHVNMLQRIVLSLQS